MSTEPHAPERPPGGRADRRLPPARRADLRRLVAVVLVLVVVGLVVPLGFPYAEGGDAYWTLIGVNGARVLWLAMAGFGALVCVDLLRGRSVVGATLALALVAPMWTWSGGDGGIVALTTVRMVQESDYLATSFTTAALILALSGLAVLLYVVGAAAVVAVSYLRWWFTSDEPMDRWGEVVVAVLAVACLLGSWSVGRFDTTLGGVEQPRTPPELLWELLDRAPVIDQVLRIAAVLLTLLLILSVTRLPAATRRRAWLAASAASATVFLGGVLFRYDGDVDRGGFNAVRYEIRPAVPFLLLQLGVVLAFVVLAWMASTRLPSDADGESAPKDVSWLSGTTDPMADG